MKNIGVLGSGPVGRTLASGFIKYGYNVMLGSRNPEKLKDWQTQNENRGKIGTFEDAAKFGEIIVLSVKGDGAKHAIKLADKDNFKGKIVIDTTNPIEDKPPENGVIKFFTDANESLMEELQDMVDEARFVKAFNSIGNATMVNPDFGGITPSMFICGNDETAKREVSEILTQFGWEPVDVGKANAAGAIENLCILWCVPAILKNQRYSAFKYLKK